MQLCMIGANHECAAIEDRERLSFSDADVQAWLPEMLCIAREGVILSTCNRTEVYALFDGERDGPEELRRFLAFSRGLSVETVEGCTMERSGPEAVHHLLRVSSGLDSMMLGEPQILTQIQHALVQARAAGSAGPLLSRLCMEALRTGKLARTRTGIARNRLSISHAAIDLASQQLDGLSGRAMLVIGAGQIATITARLLRNAKVGDLVIANRSEARGMALALDTGGRYVPLDDLPGELARMDGLVAAAATPGYVLDGSHGQQMMARSLAPLVAVDLAVPRTIAPELHASGHMRLFSVDDLQHISEENRARYEGEIAKAEAIVAQSVGDFQDWWRTRAVVPTIAALHDHAEEIRQREVQRTLRRLQHLSERDRELVEALSSAIVNKMLHYPVTRVKQHTETGQHEQSSEHLLDLFGLRGEARE